MVKEYPVLQKEKGANFIFVLVLVYIFVSFSPNTDLSFIILGIILSCLCPFIRKIKFPPIFILFIINYTLVILFCYKFWKPGFDIKDLISSYLFFGVIPVIFSSLGNTYINDIEKAIKTFWFILAFALCIWGVKDGINWDRALIFNMPYLHKNGVATFFEMGFLICFFSFKSGVYLNKILFILLGILSALVIGSKTTLLLLFIFIATGNYLRTIIKYFVFILLPIMIGIFLYNKEISSYLLSQKDLYTAHLRFILWDKAIVEIFKDFNSITFGIGPGNYNTSSLIEGDLSLVNSPHNFLLTILHAYGVLGFACFFRFFLNIFYKNTNLNFSYVAVFSLFFLHSLFDVGWVKGSGFFIAMVTGLMFASIKKRNVNSYKINIHK